MVNMTIVINSETKSLLNGLKIVPQESYNSLIERMLETRSPDGVTVKELMESKLVR